jgi:hypothetical protein
MSINLLQTNLNIYRNNILDIIDKLNSTYLDYEYFKSLYDFNIISYKIDLELNKTTDINSLYINRIKTTYNLCRIHYNNLQLEYIDLKKKIDYTQTQILGAIK